MAGQVGLEPTTCGFGDRRSANWSYWPVSHTLLFVSQSCLCSSEACQGNTIRAAGDVVKTDLVEHLDGVGIAAVLAAHAADQIGITFMAQFDAHLHELGNARIDGCERVVRQKLLGKVLRNELGLDVLQPFRQ